MGASWGVPGEFDIAGAAGDVDISQDPASGINRGPPDAIEILGAGTLVVICYGDDTAGMGGGPLTRTLGGAVPLAQGEVLNGLSVKTIVKAGTSITGVRVRWNGGS